MTEDDRPEPPPIDDQHEHLASSEHPPPVQPPSRTEEFQLPHSVYAEKEILSAALWDSRKVMPDAIAKLIPSDFYVERHGLIFSAMVEIFNRDGVIEIGLLGQLMDDAGTLDRAGGNAALSALMDASGTVQNAAHYTSEIRRKALSRQVVELGRDLEAEGMNTETDAAELVGRVDSLVRKRTDRAGLQEAVTLSDGLDSLDAAMRKADEHQGIMGVKTGIDALDEAIGGTQDQEIGIFAGSSMGKTSLLMGSFVLPVLEAGHRVLCATNEGKPRLLAARLIAAVSGVPVNIQVRGERQMSDQDRARFIRGRNRIDKIKDRMIVLTCVPIEEIRAKAERMKREPGGLYMVSLDYLQNTPCSIKPDNQERQNAHTSDGMQALNLSLEVCTVTLAQPTVSAERGGRITVNDMRGGQTIKAGREIILLPYRWEETTHNGMTWKAEICIGKNKEAPTLTIGPGEVEFNGAKMRFQTPDLRSVSAFSERRF